MSKPIWSDEDFTNFMIITHGVKSALANVKEIDLSKIANRLELIVKEKNIETIKLIAPQFLEQLREIIQDFEQRSSDIVSDSPVENVSELHKKLTEAQRACEVYNKRDAKIALADLSNYKWSEETSKLISDLGLHLLHSEFEEASSAIKDFLKDRTSPECF